MRRPALRALYWGVIAALTLPLSLIALTSFSSSDIVGFPLAPPTLRWYAAALRDPEFRTAFALSAGVAASSALLAVAAGTWIALAAAAIASPWIRLAFLAGAVLPLVTPGLVHAIALRMAVAALGAQPGPLAIVLGHAIHATPYAALMVGARRATLPPELIDAARDLGSGPGSVLIHVVLPWLLPALLGAAVLALLTSFDDFIRSFFLGGYDPTLPVLVFGRMRSGLTPEVNAIATIVLLAACALGIATDRLLAAAPQPS